MRYFVQHNNHCCVLTCFAMFLDVIPKKLVEHIGEDGDREVSEGIFRGHHLCELIDISIRKYHIFPFVIERFPKHVYDKDDEEVIVEFDEIDIKWYLSKFDGIILYAEHAGVWCDPTHDDLLKNKVYNPIGRKIPLETIWDDVSGFIGFP